MQFDISFVYFWTIFFLLFIESKHGADLTNFIWNDWRWPNYERIKQARYKNDNAINRINLIDFWFNRISYEYDTNTNANYLPNQITHLHTRNTFIFHSNMFYIRLDIASLHFNRFFNCSSADKFIRRKKKQSSKLLTINTHSFHLPASVRMHSIWTGRVIERINLTYF